MIFAQKNPKDRSLPPAKKPAAKTAAYFSAFLFPKAEEYTAACF